MKTFTIILLKGILFYITFAVTLITLCGVEGMFNFAWWCLVAISATLIGLCAKFISLTEIEKILS